MTIFFCMQTFLLSLYDLKYYKVPLWLIAIFFGTAIYLAPITLGFTLFFLAFAYGLRSFLNINLYTADAIALSAFCGQMNKFETVGLFLIISGCLAIFLHIFFKIEKLPFISILTITFFFITLLDNN